MVDRRSRDGGIITSSAVDLGVHGIRVNAICPLHGMSSTFRDNALGARFLASDDTTYMSGVCMPTTDGGVLGGSSL